MKTINLKGSYPVEVYGMDDLSKVVYIGKSIEVILDYPLGAEFSFTFRKKSEHNWTINDIINSIRKAYYKVYDNCDKYRVWGHDIYDLSINCFDIKDNKIYPGIGS